MLSSSLALQNEPHVRAFKRVTSNQLDMIFECCERHNISVVTLSDDDYPERLREIDDPPALLFVRREPPSATPVMTPPAIAEIIVRLLSMPEP